VIINLSRTGISNNLFFGIFLGVVETALPSTLRYQFLVGNKVIMKYKSFVDSRVKRV
jgi:hypothetical protein